jgi:hypothetical protein
VINGQLIVGGLFSSPASGVARWDGVSWSGLGRTGGLPRVVNALTVYNGQLVAGCDADSSQVAPDFDVAIWDGATWSPIGPPGPGLDPFVCVVRALAVYGGQLVAGGFFPSPSGPALFVASYDGVGWNLLGQGGPDGEVFTLSVFGTELVAGGLFTSVDGVLAPYIARFGTTWSAFDQFFDEFVSTTTVHQGVLYAGGGFTSPAGRAAGGYPVGVARWDGFKWVGLGSGLQFFGESVNTLVSHQGSLWIAGSFERAGPAASEKIARWDGG